MDLNKTIKFPEISIPAIKIGRHRVNRLACKEVKLSVVVNESEHAGLWQLTTQYEPPYDVVLLKKWNTRANIPEGVCCLKFKRQGDLDTLDDSTELVWEQPPFIDSELTPDDIVSSWADQFHFKQDMPEVGRLGLRKPQLGALHAISAHLATDRELEPATVVLPTGTGKTETMLSALIYHQCKTLLVIVPSDSLREQISGKFLTLGYLAELGVVPLSCSLPLVLKLKGGIGSVVEAKALAAAANVIVATPNIFRSDESVAKALCEECSYLFIDEAHHISAKSWLNVRNQFIGGNVVQFTATPFRNDGKALGGRIIYNYTMGEAQRAGYFTSVKLNPIEEFYDELADRAIAEEAIGILRSDIDENYDHLMMARVKSKPRANEVFSIYRELASDLNPIIVHSDFSKTVNRARLEKLISRESKIVICVDMLGEGYDLPNLKVAAIHDHHKSLAITLQFIGRFTRTATVGNLGDASVVVNIAEPGVESDLQRLYAQDSDWDVVLRRLSEKRIEREVTLQEVVDELKGKGNLHNQLSLWNLKPSYSAMLFKTQCEEWEPEKFIDLLPKFEEHWYSIAEEKNILVVLGVQSSPVKWGEYKELRDTNYKLLIMCWDADKKALFIFSNDYKVFRVEKLAELICGEDCNLVSGDKVFNVFNGMEYPLVRNLGAAQIGAISFTQFFGSNVTEGLSKIEASQSSLSNIAALGYENGDRVIWGCSQKKGKIWSPQKSGSLSDWCEWVTNAWDKVFENEGDIADGNITKDFLRPQRINAQYSERPISLQWGEQILAYYDSKVTVFFGENEIPLYLVDLNVERDEAGVLKITLSSDAFQALYILEISVDHPKGYEYILEEGEQVRIQKGNGAVKDFVEYMIADPITIYYVDGSFSYNCYLISVPADIGLFSKDDIAVDDWIGVDLQKESMHSNQISDSIQYYVFKSIEDDYPIIINDDGSGEAADLVALKFVDDEIVLTLIHCKYSSAPTSGARLKDLYEVCGQAQRSIRWKHVGINHLYHHIKRREELWRARNETRFLKGSLSELAIFKKRSRTCSVRLEVVIAQPGISASLITNEMLKLLGSTALYIKKTTMAELQVTGSA